MLPFESHGGHLKAYNDGHVPETFRFQSEHGSSSCPQIVHYDIPSRSEVHIYDNVLHEHHARMLYDVTSDTSTGQNLKGYGSSLQGESPWGTYVTIEEALHWIEWKQTSEFHEVGKRENGKTSCSNSLSYQNYQSRWKEDIINFHNWLNTTKSSTVSPKAVSNGIDNNILDMDSVRHALAVESVAQSFLQTIPVHPGSIAPDPPSRHETLYELNHFLKHAHGVAVWALSSKAGHSVQYHIDYAELLRYEYNVTVPPLWAGTVQCSEIWNNVCIDEDSIANDAEKCDGIHECCGHCHKRNQVFQPEMKSIGFDSHPHRSLRCIFDGVHECSSVCEKPQWNTTSSKTPQQNSFMRGGEFCVNLRGLEHYSEHGYKGNISGDAYGGWKRPIQPKQSQYNTNVFCESSQWVTIPYAFNRGIVHKGDLPHLSAPIESIEAIETNSGSRNSSFKSRVIVGFNVFGHGVGEVIAKAPEHSKAFRRKVKLYRATVGACASNESSEVDIADINYKKQNGLNISQISENRALKKLLVLAKREVVKEEFRQQQQQLMNVVWRKLLERIKNEAPSPTVLDILKELGNAEICYGGKVLCPKPDDVHAQLNRMIIDENSFRDVDGKFGVPGASYKVFVNDDVEQNDKRRNAWIALSAVIQVAKIN
eukprot:scaffold37642_cov96-Cyclotella_meneghiniana.AAC.6